MGLSAAKSMHIAVLALPFLCLSGWKVCISLQKMHFFLCGTKSFFMIATKTLLPEKQVFKGKDLP